MSQYNLIDEKWIPVLDLAGNREELGIRDVLLKSENLSRIEDPSPLVTAALHRFLLAVLYRALEGPCDIDAAKKYFREGLPKEKIKTYLKKWYDRFWLFDDNYPFYQIPSFQPQKWNSWTTIAAEHNANNAKVLFDHIDINRAGNIRFSKSVLWLLATQTFALSAGNSELSYTGNSPSAGASFVIPIGKNLLDTLVFCLIPQNKEIMKNDLPVWEREPETLEYLKSTVKVLDKKNGKEKNRAIERSVTGIVDLYTWRSRSIIFKKSDDVSHIGFASGIGYKESNIEDPMVAYALVDKKDDKKNIIKIKQSIHLDDKGIWRDFDSLLPDDSNLVPKVIEHSLSITRNISDRFPKGILILGQKYNPPRPNIEFWRKEYFILPRLISNDKYIRGDIHSYLEKAEEISKTLYSACATFAQALLAKDQEKRKADKKDVSRFISQMIALPHYWSTLESKFHEILRDYTLEKNPDDIHHDWLVAIRKAISDAWKLHQRSVSGSDAWGIRALVKGEDIIAKKIIELNQDIQKLKEVV
ncbi:MAG: hypothetical protein ACD_79C01434G0008 [uncultured bacterium]|nr:MAG: hypothetical protein ACD_79C01434G0008 [uncultured bacterium]